MVLKYIQSKSSGIFRVILDLALLMIALSVAFNFIGYQRLTKIAISNNRNGRIIKAATGCGDTDSVAQCKKAIEANGQNQIVVFLQQEDCWTRRALAHLPAPQQYNVPCQFP